MLHCFDTKGTHEVDFQNIYEPELIENAWSLNEDLKQKILNRNPRLPTVATRDNTNQMPFEESKSNPNIGNFDIKF